MLECLILSCMRLTVPRLFPYYVIDCYFFASFLDGVLMFPGLLACCFAAPGISASPSEENMRYFNVMILGPSQSPYEGEESFPLVLLFRVLITSHIWYMINGFGNGRWNLGYWKFYSIPYHSETTNISQIPLSLIISFQ